MIDHVCAIHGKKLSEHICLYCCLCFSDLTEDQCHIRADGTKEDVCNRCTELEVLANPNKPSKNPIMILTTTAEFDQFWREAGQFIHPCDRLRGESLEPFRQFAHGLYGHMNSGIAEADQAVLEHKHDLEETQNAFRILKASILAAINTDWTSTQKEAELRRLCED